MKNRRQHLGSAQVLVWAALASVSCGGSTGAHVATELSGLQVSGAEVSKQGKVRILFTSPVSDDTDVALASSAPAVASVPDHVTVPKGALAADVAYDAKAIGTAQITARYGDASFISSAAVVDQIRLTTGGSLTLEVGAISSSYFSVNIQVPEATELMIAPADPAIATAPATITISPFSSNQSFLVTAAGAGVTNLVATRGDQHANAAITVVDHARIIAVGVPAAVELGGPVVMSLSVDAVVAATTPITVTSSDPSVAPAPTSFVMPAGSNFATSTLTPSAAGQTTFSFALGGSTLSAGLLVVGSARLTSLSLPGSLTAGQTTSLSVALDVTAAVPHTIALKSSDASVLPVPDHVTIVPGQRTATVDLAPLINGDAVVTASLADVQVQALAHVGAPPAGVLTLSNPGHLMVGAVGSLSITTGASYAIAQNVSLASSDPAVLSVQSDKIVSGSAAVTVTALKAGTATITATGNGMTATQSVVVVDQAKLTQFGPVITLDIGKSASVYAYFDALVPAGTKLSFSTSDATVVAAPAPVVANTGGAYGYVLLTGLASGTALVTATYGGSSATAIVYVGTASTTVAHFYSMSCNGLALQVGASSYCDLQVSSPGFATDVSVPLTFTTPGVLTTPSTTITVLAGQTTVYFPITGAMAGTTDITAQLQGTSSTATFNVFATPTLSLSVPATIKAGATLSATLSANCMLAADLSVSLTSTNPGFATVNPATVIYGGGPRGGVNFGVTGVAAGATMINAMYGATTVSAPLTVTP